MGLPHVHDLAAPVDHAVLQPTRDARGIDEALDESRERRGEA